MLIDAPPLIDTTVTTGDDIWLFQEQSGLTLTQPLGVDGAGPGTYTLQTAQASFVEAVAVVDVWTLFTNGNSSGPTNYSGAATFSTEILGMIFLSSSLLESDSLPRPSDTYRCL